MFTPCRSSAQDGRVVNARLVVAADGANSKVRQMAGLRTYGWDYNQRAVVATVQTEGMELFGRAWAWVKTVIGVEDFQM